MKENKHLSDRFIEILHSDDDDDDTNWS